MNNKISRLRNMLHQVAHYVGGIRYIQPVSAHSHSILQKYIAKHTNPSPKNPVRPTPPAPGATSPVVAQSADDSEGLTRQAKLKALAKQIMQCNKCPLHTERIQAVPGIGVLDPVVMVIGEAPGANEDKHGKPFIGRAGQYLDKWLEAIEIYRTQNAYIANIIKCRPPQNRDPVLDEIKQCRPYLEQQIELIRPRTILIVGRIAAHHLLGIEDTLAKMRTSQYMFRGIPTFVTYHPSAVLRNPQLRRPVWEDMQKLKAFIQRK